MVAYKKRLEGIQMTEDLQTLLDVAKEKANSIQGGGGDKSRQSSNHHNALLLDVDKTNIIPDCSDPKSWTIEYAASVLQQFTIEDNTSEVKRIPIRVLRAMQIVLNNTSSPLTTTTTTSSSSCAKKEEGIGSVVGDEVNTVPLLHHFLSNKMLNQSQLVFTSSPKATSTSSTEDDTTVSPAQRQWRQRMERLRLRSEQDKYFKITQNLGMNAIQDDGITTKSMTYAASIGLNMIVAPITFGVFMYFFAGALLDRFWPVITASQSTTDIKRVIAGVISGVLMLFIEMILFVIRTNEMDKALRKKQRKSCHQGPFGYYTATTSKTYKDR